MDLSAYDGVISTKAPAYAIRHPNHVCYLQHTMRVFYDLFNLRFPRPTREVLNQRELIHRLDTAALQPPCTRRLFVISQEVQSRLLRFNDLKAKVLFQASTLSGFRTGDYRYLFMPGRLNRWKRVDLVIQAMQFVRSRVPLLITGTGEEEDQLRRLAAGDQRIRWLGWVSDEELLSLYADALAVPFVPLYEDFGLIILEAFHSGKPVITCWDSGEPARLIRDGQTGSVCDPDPHAIAACIDYLAAHPEEAAARGRRGAESVAHLSWDRVAADLLAALDLTPGVSSDRIRLA
jgi:glycosyltransferase involved in cell wall biosynthesis